MFKSGLKTLGAICVLGLLPFSAYAVDRGPAVTNSDNIDVSQAHLDTSEMCAMQLGPIAKEIFSSISPKVHKDSDLRKLVKKQVRPKVFSGKLSVKKARENAQAASVCLSLLKMETNRA